MAPGRRSILAFLQFLQNLAHHLSRKPDHAGDLTMSEFGHGFFTIAADGLFSQHVRQASVNIRQRHVVCCQVRLRMLPIVLFMIFIPL
jgi:hypothetical protein